MNGKLLFFDLVEMNVIMVYMKWLLIGVFIGVNVVGWGFEKIDILFVLNCEYGKLVYEV